MTKKEIRQMTQKIYTAVEKSGLTSRKYHTTDWMPVYNLREIAQSTLPENVRIIFGDNWYQKNDLAEWKTWDLTAEDAMTGEVYFCGQIRAFAAGSVDDVWSAFDLTASWYIN